MDRNLLLIDLLSAVLGVLFSVGNLTRLVMTVNDLSGVGKQLHTGTHLVVEVAGESRDNGELVGHNGLVYQTEMETELKPIEGPRLLKVGRFYDGHFPCGSTTHYRFSNIPFSRAGFRSDFFIAGFGLMWVSSQLAHLVIHFCFSLSYLLRL